MDDVDFKPYNHNNNAIAKEVITEGFFSAFMEDPL